MALWAKNKKYPAKIIRYRLFKILSLVKFIPTLRVFAFKTNLLLRFEPDGSYLVEFYDGFKKHLRPQSIR
jgi:hypothetical protein